MRMLVMHPVFPCSPFWACLVSTTVLACGSSGSDAGAAASDSANGAGGGNGNGGAGGPAGGGAACGFASCDGCCSAGKCLPGTEASACGVGGGVCATCTAAQTCTGGGCTSGKLALFGGIERYSDRFLDDTWLFDGAAWTRVNVASGPMARAAHAAATLAGTMLLQPAPSARVRAAAASGPAWRRTFFPWYGNSAGLARRPVRRLRPSRTGCAGRRFLWEIAARVNKDRAFDVRRKRTWRRDPMRRSTLVIVSLSVASAAAFAPSAIAGNPPFKPAVTPDVKPGASLVPGLYQLTFTAKHVGGKVVNSSTTFSVAIASQGSKLTLTDPGAAAGSAAAATTGNGAFLGKAFSLHLAVGQSTVLLSATAPSPTALSSLTGNFVESAPGQPAVDGTFSLQQQPLYHTEQPKIKQFGSGGSGDSSGSIWDEIKAWFSGLSL